CGTAGRYDWDLDGHYSARDRRGAADQRREGSLRCFAQPFVTAAQIVENGERARHGKFTRPSTESGACIRHHIAVLDARKNVKLDIAHTRGHRAKGVKHLWRRLIVFVTPDDADWGGPAFQPPDGIRKGGAVTRKAGGVAESFRSKKGIGTAVAETHNGGAPIEFGQIAQLGERVGHVGLAGLDFFRPRHRASGCELTVGT